MEALIEFLNHWENVPFLVAIIVGAIFLGLQVLGLGLSEVMGGAHAEADAHVSVDTPDVHADVPDAHVEAHVEAPDVDADLDADLDGGVHSPDVAGAEGPGLFGALLQWLNIGRAPFMAVVQSFLLGFGLIGLFATGVLRDQAQAAGGGLSSVEAALYAVPFALVLGLLITKALTGLFARFAPTLETKGTGKRCLVGLIGEVTSASVNATSGRVSVKDKEGDVYTVFCHTQPTAAPVLKGQRVTLLSYEPTKDRYVVQVEEAAAPKLAADAPKAA